MTRRSRSGAERRTGADPGAAGATARKAPPPTHPSTPGAPLLDEAERALRATVEARDRLFERSRRLRRTAQDVMRGFHAGEEPTPTLRVLDQEVRELRRAGALEGSGVADALQEYAEARLLEAVVRGRPLPTLRTLDVPVEAYLLALGDLVGEVRRLAISALGQEELTEAERLLALMEALLHALLRFEAPRGVVALKPKQDTARALVERTRAEVALARVLRRASVAVGAARGDRWLSEGLKATDRLG